MLSKSGAVALRAVAEVRRTFTMAAASSVTAEALARVTFQKPVPSDIAVSQSVEPLHISKIAEAAGILPEELELYGSYKAKVRNTTLCCPARHGIAAALVLHCTGFDPLRSNLTC